MSYNKSPHSFHIPVMGTGFTIDTPLAVAKYGISSVVSLVDDILIEEINKHLSEKYSEPYTVIDPKDEDARAKRITAYLNLVDKIVNKQFSALKASEFVPNSEITSYFSLLPNTELKQLYIKMLENKDLGEKTKMQQSLRDMIVPGSIDVNIMTKLDRLNYRADKTALPYEFCDAASALRGYANSTLSSSLVLSAGFNPNLYNYMASFPDFLPDKNGTLKKKICLKVSDFRSAFTQGKYLAKHGIWTSEFRIESPINCGGHAFANNGGLLGPILEEFKERREELTQTLRELFKKFHSGKDKTNSKIADYPICFSAQGGVGTNTEHEFLLSYYKLDSIGWGSPFLMVPEVTNVDENQLKKLINATSNDIFLSSSSPLGINLWNLRNSDSEEARIKRINQSTPGSHCVKGFGKLNYEFTEQPICRASMEYQKSKLAELEAANLPPEQTAYLKEEILNKSCICHDLGGGLTIKKGINTSATSAICPGPNIINFKKIMTLKEIIGHIYGFTSMLTNDSRPNLFIREIQLNIDFLSNEMKKSSLWPQPGEEKKLAEIKKNLISGILYYQKRAKDFFQEQEKKTLIILEKLKVELDKIAAAAGSKEESAFVNC